MWMYSLIKPIFKKQALWSTAIGTCGLETLFGNRKTVNCVSRRLFPFLLDHGMNAQST